MDPNDNRIIVQLLNTCFICRQMYVTSRDLNRHLHENHELPVMQYNRPEPLHIEMIPTEQYLYLNMLTPNFANAPQHAVFVTIRHACSLCHSHYLTLERLFRHMEAHFRAKTQEEHNDEIDELDQSFEFFDTHPWNYRPTEAAPSQQENAIDTSENENESFQTNDGMINQNGFHADDEDSVHVKEDKDSDQQDSGHVTSGADSQNIVDDDRNEKTAINSQQELDPQDTDGAKEESYINNLILSNDDRDITLYLLIDGDNINPNGQPIVGDIALQERAGEDI